MEKLINKKVLIHILVNKNTILLGTDVIENYDSTVIYLESGNEISIPENSIFYIKDGEYDDCYCYENDIVTIEFEPL